MAIGMAALALAAIALLIAVNVRRPGGQADRPGIAPPPIQVERIDPAAVTPAPPRPAPEAAVRETIRAHIDEAGQDPRHEDAPARLFAAANLTRQRLLDYAAAADLYERLLQEYPEWMNLDEVYIQLITCYERMGDETRLRHLYAEIQDRYPPEADLHLFVLEQMGP